MTQPIKFIPAGDDIAYVEFESPTKPRQSARTIRLVDVFPELKGPDLIIDIDKDQRIIGLEILV